MKVDVEQFLKGFMVVLLTLRAECSLVGSGSLVSLFTNSFPKRVLSPIEKRCLPNMESGDKGALLPFLPVSLWPIFARISVLGHTSPR